MIEIDNLLQSVVQARASDLHLAVGTPPVVRVNGGLKMVQRNGALSPQDIEDVLTSITTPESMASFLRDKELTSLTARMGWRDFGSMHVTSAALSASPSGYFPLIYLPLRV